MDERVIFGLVFLAVLILTVVGNIGIAGGATGTRLRDERQGRRRE